MIDGADDIATALQGSGLPQNLASALQVTLVTRLPLQSLIAPGERMASHINYPKKHCAPGICLVSTCAAGGGTWISWGAG